MDIAARASSQGLWGTSAACARHSKLRQPGGPMRSSAALSATQPAAQARWDPSANEGRRLGFIPANPSRRTSLSQPLKSSRIRVSSGFCWWFPFEDLPTEPIPPEGAALPSGGQASN